MEIFLAILAIKYVVEEISGERGEGKTIVEESPKGSHESNGVIERGVQTMEGHIRGMLLGLEDRLGRRRGARAANCSWPPLHAGNIGNMH